MYPLNSFIFRHPSPASVTYTRLGVCRHKPSGARTGGRRPRVSIRVAAKMVIRSDVCTIFSFRRIPSAGARSRGDPPDSATYICARLYPYATWHVDGDRLPYIRMRLLVGSLIFGSDWLYFAAQKIPSSAIISRRLPQHINMRAPAFRVQVASGGGPAHHVSEPGLCRNRNLQCRLVYYWHPSDSVGIR